MKGTIICAAAVAALGCWSLTADSNSAAAEPQPSNTTMQIETPAAGDFLSNLPKGFEQPSDDAGRLLLREYGAVFLTRGGAIPPKKVVFKDEADVQAFQSSLQRSVESIGGIRVELQTAAMTALLKAIAEARAVGLTIGPRGADSAKRGYDQTVGLWASRVNPGLVHWVGKGRITQAEAHRIRSLTPYQQVPEILKLEQQQIFFARSLDKSIIYSVAPPGTSQHISMLALDVKEFENAKVRDILANNGWYQTVVSDLPHFTFLGVKKTELPKLGLKEVSNSGRNFWIPNI
jgi:hypothetical protein